MEASGTNKVGLLLGALLLKAAASTSQDNEANELLLNELEQALPALYSEVRVSEDCRHPNIVLTQSELASLREKYKPEFQRISVSKLEEDRLDVPRIKSEVSSTRQHINNLLSLRDKYIFYDDFLLEHPLLVSIRPTQKAQPNPALKGEVQLEFKSGVYRPVIDGQEVVKFCGVVEYYLDLAKILSSMHDGMYKTISYRRLEMLQHRFQFHLMYNREREIMETKIVPSIDFYKLHKVDNHVHLAACMSQEHLLDFMKRKYEAEPDRVVKYYQGQPITLRQVFVDIDLKPHELTVDALSVAADHTTFHRFDQFNAKYNPSGQPVLRDVFLKSDNSLNGDFFAEMCKEVFSSLEANKYQMAEYRISIYGRSSSEWLKLSQWFLDHEMTSPNVTWLIQIPRIYHIYRANGTVSCFGDMLRNIFEPIFQATLFPDEHPQVAEFLNHIVGFDSVDDESCPERVHSYTDFKAVSPDQWVAEENPPYSYWSYYIYANLTTLNHLRLSRGLNSIAFRPHCGEAGSHEHLAVAYLTAHSINHGIELMANPLLCYLFYLKQIGASVSPLSNNKLFLKYKKNPFPRFMQIGLNATLSTDDPLIIHLTKEPLLEEYSVAAQVWDLSNVDLCEIVRNSVIQSGFNKQTKKQWLGDHFEGGTPESNDINFSNLPHVRYMFRYETFHEENLFLSTLT
jgi:AMP deaminase